MVAPFAPPPAGPSPFPGVVPEAAEQLLQLPPDIQPIVAEFLSTLEPGDQLAFFTLPIATQAEILTAFLSSPQGAHLAPQALPDPTLPPPGAMPQGDPMLAPPSPGVPQPGDPLPPLPPLGDPLLDPALAGALPPLPADPALAGAPVAPPPLPGVPDLPGPLETPEVAAKPERKAYKPPKLKLPEPPPDRYEGKGPSHAVVLAHAREARDRYRPRDERIVEDKKLYYLVPNPRQADGSPVEAGAQPLLQTRADAAQMVDRVIGHTELKLDALKLELLAPTDDAEAREAAQVVEDTCRTMLAEWFGRWDMQGSMGNPQPSLGRKVAGLLALEGGCGAYLTLDPDEPDCPIHYEPIGWSQLYPMRHNTTRQFEMSLAEARVQYPEIEEALPAVDESGNESPHAENAAVRVIGWCDERYHAIAWEMGGEGDWIKAPAEHHLGFRPYQLPPLPLGTPAAPEPDLADEYYRFLGAGVLTHLHRVFQQLDQMMNIVMELAKQAVNPPVVEYLDPDNPDDTRPKLDRRSGSQNYRGSGDRVEALETTLAGRPDGTTVIQSLLAQISNAGPPVLGGGGTSQSGLDRSLQGQSASALTIDPIIDAIERHIELVLRLAVELMLRTMRQKGAARLFTGLEYRAYSGEAPGTLGRLEARHLELVRLRRTSGGLTVRVDRLSSFDRQQLGLMLGNLVQMRLKSRFEAMKELGTDDPQRETKRIFAEMALEDPAFMKSLAGWALMQEAPPEIVAFWQAERAKELAPAPAAQPPAQPGMVSPPAPAAPPAAPAPGVPGQPGQAPLAPVPM